VLIVLIQQWLNDSRAHSQWSPRTESRSLSMSMTSDMFQDEAGNKRHSYQVINNLLRIVRKGPAVKNTVDEVIDRCAIVMNLRDSIEDERILAEKATDEKQKRIHASKGVSAIY
jgi:hypothetical protein